MDPAIVLQYAEQAAVLRANEEQLALLNEFRGDIGNIEICKEFLTRDGVQMSVQTRLWVSGSMKGMTKEGCTGVWTQEVATGQLQWFIGYMMASASVEAESITSDMAQCAAHIIMSYWMHLGCREGFGALAEFFQRDLKHWKAAICVYKEMMDIFATDWVKQDREIRKVKINFMEDGMRTIFGTCCELLGQLPKVRETLEKEMRETLEKALDTISMCLIIKRDKTRDEIKWDDRSDTPASMKDAISCQTLGMFLEVYRGSGCYQALMCIYGMSLMRDDIIGPRELIPYLSTLFMAVNEIISTGMHLGDVRNRYCLGNVCATIAGRILPEIATGIPFLDFLRAMAGYTMDVLVSMQGELDDVSGESMITDIITFWTNIYSPQLRQGDWPEMHATMAELTGQIFFRYIDFMKARVQSNPEIAFKSISEGRLSPQLGIITKLISIRNSEAIIARLKELYHEAKERMVAAATPEENTARQLDMSLFVQLLTSQLIQVKDARKKSDNDMKCQAQIFACLMDAVILTKDRIGTAQLPCLEDNILYFIKQFSNSVFGQPHDRIEPLYAEFSGVNPGFFGAIANPMAISKLLFERAVISLRAFTVASTVQLGIEALGSLKPDTDGISLILGNINDSFFAFFGNPDCLIHRMELFKMITSIIIQESHDMMLPAFLGAIDGLVGQATPENIIGIATHIRGVFATVAAATSSKVTVLAKREPKKDRVKENCAKIIQWLIPDRSNKLIEIMPAVAAHIMPSRVLLEMWKSIVEHTNVAAVDFSPFSPNGLIVFKQSVDLVVPYLMTLAETAVERDVYEEKYVGFGICCDIANILLKADWVPFYALDMYSDDCAHRLIFTLAGFMKSLDLSDVSGYTDIMTKMVTLAKVILNEHAARVATVDMAFMPFSLHIAATLIETSVDKDLVKASLDIISGFGWFVTDGPGQQEQASIVEGCREQLEHAIRAVWTWIFNVASKNNRNHAAEAAMYLMIISSAQLQMVASILSERVDDAGFGDWLGALMTGLAGEIGSRDGTKVSVSLSKLVDVAKSKGIRIVF